MSRDPLVNHIRKGYLLRRTLVLLGVSIALGSAATLAFAAKRIAAENAAFISSKNAPMCLPSQLNRSAVLPGTSLAVSPLPDSLDASNSTQISLLGYAVADLSSVTVRGAESGDHSGRLEPYSQGDGASFVPSKPFRSGELVTVHGKVTAAGKAVPFAFHFTTAIRDAIGHPASTPKPAGKTGELDVFHSRHDLHVPVVTVTKSSPQQSPGYMFIAPYSGAGQNGPMIVDSSGNLVWFDPLPSGAESTNLQVQQYEGKPVLTWWQGYIPPQGFGQGEEVIANSAYEHVLRMRAGNGFLVDLHEFKITPQNTALLTVFDPIRCNLSQVGGPSNGAVTDSLFQEIDLKTHLVRREWHPLDHVPLTHSYSSAVSASTAWPYDYFHLNSIDLHQDGSILISSRNTSALYELNSAGQITAQLGGKNGSLKLGKGTATAYQHDAQELPNGNISVFDNGGVPKVHPQSRGLIISVNPHAKSDTMVTEYEHSKPLAAGSQGNIQMLENGNVFIGWGAEPYLSEYAANGALLFDAHLPPKAESYRAYRFPWTGAPASRPAIAAAAGAHGTTSVYASWNGATAVASWRVLGGTSAKSLAPLASAAKSGFETTIATPGKPAYVAVQALDAAANVLGASPTVKG
jgi:hypothetical protein